MYFRVRGTCIFGLLYQSSNYHVFQGSRYVYLWTAVSELQLSSFSVTALHVFQDSRYLPTAVSELQLSIFFCNSITCIPGFKVRVSLDCCIRAPIIKFFCNSITCIPGFKVRVSLDCCIRAPIIKFFCNSITCISRGRGIVKPVLSGHSKLDKKGLKDEW